MYEAIRRSPVWNTNLLVIVYDEHGGFYNSVKPGRAVPPGDVPLRGQPALNSRGFDFSHYGMRVPAVVVSPLIPKGKVDPTVYGHASILATLERLLGMGRSLDETPHDRPSDVEPILTNSKAFLHSLDPKATLGEGVNSTRVKLGRVRPANHDFRNS